VGTLTISGLMSLEAASGAEGRRTRQRWVTLYPQLHIWRASPTPPPITAVSSRDLVDRDLLGDAA
jgi:hypothetical protein